MQIKELVTLDERWIQTAAQQLHPEQLQQRFKTLEQWFSDEGSAAADMIETYNEWLQGNADPDAVKTANHQLVRLLKYLGLAGVAVLPGSTFLLPILIKIAQHYGIKLIPDPIKQH